MGDPLGDDRVIDLSRLVRSISEPTKIVVLVYKQRHLSTEVSEDSVGVEVEQHVANSFSHNPWSSR